MRPLHLVAKALLNILKSDQRRPIDKYENTKKELEYLINYLKWSPPETGSKDDWRKLERISHSLINKNDERLTWCKQYIGVLNGTLDYRDHL